MKNMLIALLAVLTLASGSAAAQSARIEIVPKPAEIVAFENQAVYKDPVLVWLDPQAIGIMSSKRSARPGFRRFSSISERKPIWYSGSIRRR